MCGVSCGNAANFSAPPGRAGPRSRGGLLLLLALASSLLYAREPGTLTVAAAADLTFALRDLASEFEHQTGTSVRITLGSSGNLYAQIQNGAPFDLFFSADAEYPQRLVQAGLAVPASLIPYAVGELVVYVPKGVQLDLEHRQLDALTSPNVSKISLANPAHAPYGRAAEAALRHAGIYEKVRARLVLGENVAQAAQFVRTGDAQAGLISRSLAQTPELAQAGRYWVVPQEMYPPLVQSAVVLSRAAARGEAERFLDFVRSEAGRKMLRRHGFLDPPAGQGKGQP